MSSTTTTKNADDIIDEPNTLVRIGAGSFAAVYVWRGGPCAYKIVHDMENTLSYEQSTRLSSPCTPFAVLTPSLLSLAPLHTSTLQLEISM